MGYLMSVQTVQTAQTGQSETKIAFFQGANSVQESQKYAFVINTANEVSRQQFKEDFLKITSKMSKLAEDWKELQEKHKSIPLTLETKQKNLETYLIQVVQLNKEGSEATTALKTIRAAYKEALQKLNPPSLDSYTLTELARFGFNLQPIESKYVELFGQCLPGMQKEIEKVETHLHSIKKATVKMKEAFEPMAYELKAGVFGPLSYIAGSTTPYMDAAIDKAKASDPVVVDTDFPVTAEA